MERHYFLTHKNAKKYILNNSPKIIISYALLIGTLYLSFFGNQNHNNAYEVTFIAFIIGVILSVFVILYDIKKTINKISNSYYSITDDRLIHHLNDGNKIEIQLTNLDKIKKNNRQTYNKF